MHILFSPPGTKNAAGLMAGSGYGGAAQHPCTPPPCSRNPKPPHTLPLSWRSTPLGPPPLKHCFRLEISSWSPPQASQDCGIDPPVGPGPCPAPQLSGPALVFRTKDGQLGVAGRLPEAPGHPTIVGPAGMVRPCGRRAARGALGVDGPSGAQSPAGGRGDAGPAWRWGRPGSGAGRRGRRRTRGAYCW